jgi:MFS family permease
MSPHARNVSLLATAQALLLTNGVMLVAMNGLVGLRLAPTAWLVTLPLTTYVLGAAIASLPAAFFMKHHGRRAGFMLGASLGCAGAVLSYFAVSAGNFWLLCLGTVLAGIYNAFGQQYRFAAADSAPPQWRARAISLTLAGGIAGGVIGPAVGNLTRNLLTPSFVASYLALAGFALLAMLIASRVDIPPLAAEQQHAAGRPVRELMRNPKLLVAVLAAACGYGVMNLLMTATALAMDSCGLPFGDAALVLEWHVIGMFAPSFFTAHLLKRFGIPRMLLTGAALMTLCIVIALSGVTLMHFWWALLLLGIGWNFLFIGGTTLLTEVCRPEERAKVQGGNDFLVLGVQALTSLTSGAMFTGSGWIALNFIALPLVAATAIGTLLYMRHVRRSPVG